MPRAPELEAVLEAWFDLETSAPSEQADRKKRLDDLLDNAISKAGMKNVSRREVLEVLREQYREFARAKWIEARRRLSRLK